MQKGYPIYFIQVKTNRIDKQVLRDIQAFSNKYFEAGKNEALVVMWKDREGWRKVYNLTQGAEINNLGRHSLKKLLDL